MNLTPDSIATHWLLVRDSVRQENALEEARTSNVEMQEFCHDDFSPEEEAMYHTIVQCTGMSLAFIDALLQFEEQGGEIVFRMKANTTN